MPLDFGVADVEKIFSMEDTFAGGRTQRTYCFELWLGLLYCLLLSCKKRTEKPSVGFFNWHWLWHWLRGFWASLYKNSFSYSFLFFSFLFFSFLFFSFLFFSSSFSILPFLFNSTHLV